LVKRIAPHTPLWKRLSLSMYSHIHDHNIDGKLQAYDLFYLLILNLRFHLINP
jgi:hypothetical protein